GGGVLAPVQPVEQVAHPQLLQQVGAVVGGGAVHRQPHRHPPAEHVGHPAHAGGQLHVGDGAVGHAGAGGGQDVQLLVVEVDAVGVPHVGASPAQPLQVGQGPQAELLQGVLLLVLRLRHVGVQAHTQSAGQACALPQQVGGHREGGAGGQGHLPHGEAGRVVPHPHQPLRVGQNSVNVLHHAVRRQAAVLL